MFQQIHLLMVITVLVEQYLGNQVGPVSTSRHSSTPTCSVHPFSTAGWSITGDSRLTACLSPSLSHNPISLIIKYEIVASGSACACFTAFSIHTKTQHPQSQNLLSDNLKNSGFFNLAVSPKRYLTSAP